MNDTRALTSHLAALLRREHVALADFLVALADFDRERRWIELGYTSCFYFLHRELALSKGAAFYRKTAAELLQRYPELIEPLRDGRLCLTSVVELAKVITPENRREVVQRFFHVSKAQAREVVAELCPTERPPQRDVVTPAGRGAAQSAPRNVRGHGPEAGAVRQASLSVHPANHPSEGSHASAQPVPAGVASDEAPPRASAVVPADDAEPLTADLRRLHVTVSRRFLDKLAAARDALSHSHPGATTEAVLEAALDLLLAADRKRKALVEKPRKSPKTSARPRHVPAEGTSPRPTSPAPARLRRSA